MIFVTRVAGVSYYMPAVRRVQKGDRVQLFREPRNKHDPNAVKVMCRRRKIGYIPATDAPRIAELLKASRIKEVTVKSIGPPAGAPELLGVLIRMEIKPSELQEALESSIAGAADDAAGGDPELAWYNPMKWWP